MSMGSTYDHDAELPAGHSGPKFDATPAHYDAIDNLPFFMTTDSTSRNGVLALHFRQ